MPVRLAGLIFTVAARIGSAPNPVTADLYVAGLRHRRLRHHRRRRHHRATVAPSPATLMHARVADDGAPQAVAADASSGRGDNWFTRRRRGRPSVIPWTADGAGSVRLTGPAVTGCER